MGAYDVGYGKPPKHSQFKPGCPSPSPSGRPKGARNVATVLRDELAQKITVTENGKEITITKLEGVVKAAAIKGLKGDPRPLIQAHELLNKLAQDPLAHPNPVAEVYEVTMVFEEEQIREMERAEREEAARLAGYGTTDFDEPTPPLLNPPDH